MSKKFSGPKRRIERIRNRIDILLTAGIVNVVLHAAEDAKTLVRTIVRLSMVHVSGTAVESGYNIMIHRAEQSAAVINPGIAQTLDFPAPNALIWEDSSTLDQVDATGPSTRKEIREDLKGMRKLKENDTIELAHIAGTVSILRLVGTITLFFKE